MFLRSLPPVCLPCLFSVAAVHGAQPLYPADSAMAERTELQRLLLNPLEEGGVRTTGAWKIRGARAAAADGLQAKAGAVAMKFSGHAEVAGAKGDFGLTGEVPGAVELLGMWIRLGENPNVREVGFQLTDAEDERLMAVREIAGSGWQWVEFDLATADFRQAYQQDGKNGAIDFPLKGVGFVWFAETSAETTIAVDGLVAATRMEVPEKPLAIATAGAAWSEPGRPYQGQLLVTNHTSEPVTMDVNFQMRRNPNLHADPEEPVANMVEERTVAMEVPPRTFRAVNLSSGIPLETDAYVIRVEAGGRMITSDYFVLPPILAPRPESRFGMNASQPDLVLENRRLGVGWIRFENMKWRFFNPAEREFRFDGTVGPWHVNHDEILRRYTEAGFSVLPYIFQTPEWATSAAEGIDENRQSHAPSDLADYGAAIFQAVARYGSRKIPEDELKTSDKRSGKGWINTYELWNEPNLNNPSWGFFVGTMGEYFELYRVGVEALKKADPAAKATSAGYAGLSLEIVDQMRTYEYADGKTPLDLTDILNVHFYTGQQDPEVARRDPNAVREGSGEGSQTLEQDLIELADWRDDLKPEMPIWVTETGYDVGGPMGKTERDQAAKLPRSLMIALANGMDKVFVYREKGSTPAQHAGAGMIRDDGTLRPVYFTYANLIRQFDGVTNRRVPRLKSDDPSAWIYQFERNGEMALAAWVPEGRGRLGVNLGKCKVTNAFGGVSEQEVGADFELSMFPVYISSFGNPAALEPLVDAAAKAEESRQAERARQSAARVYAYDFGSRHETGLRTYGSPRPFTGVLAEDVFDPEREYGFVGKGVRDESAHWIQSRLEKDAVRVNSDSVFRMTPEPGKYRLEIRAEGDGPNTSLAIRGGAEGDKTLKLQPKSEKNPKFVTEITVVENEPIELQTDGWGRLLWLALTEKTPVP